MFTGNDEFNESQESRSLWMDISLPSFPHLKTSMDTDVCIVGGGIVGLTNAYTLAKQGKSVVVLDQGSIGGEQTLRTTAHLAWALDDRFYELERLFGEDGARLTGDPYHYIRTQKNLSHPHLEWLIVGGEDHKTGQDHEIESKYDHLERWARARFPQMEKVSYKWSGQVFEPVDSLAFIGRNPGNKNIYIATGDSGNGLTHGTIAGILIPDLIMGRKNPWEGKIHGKKYTNLRVKPYLPDLNL